MLSLSQFLNLGGVAVSVLVCLRVKGLLSMSMSQSLAGGGAVPPLSLFLRVCMWSRRCEIASVLLNPHLLAV